MPARIEEKTETKEKKTKRPAKRRTIDKWKKKKWFSVVAPAFFNHYLLGETIAEEPAELAGRTMAINAAGLSGQAKLRHVMLFFQIKKVQGQKALTQFTGHKTQEAYLRRIVRRRSSKVEIIQDVVLKSGEKLRLKAVTVTSRKASRPQKTEIRKRMKTELKKASAKKTFEQFVQEMVFGMLSSNIFKNVKKIMPVKKVEITRSTQLKQKNA